MKDEGEGSGSRKIVSPPKGNTGREVQAGNWRREDPGHVGRFRGIMPWGPFQAPA